MRNYRKHLDRVDDCLARSSQGFFEEEDVLALEEALDLLDAIVEYAEVRTGPDILIGYVEDGDLDAYTQAFDEILELVINRN